MITKIYNGKEGDCIDWETEHEHREHIINECKKIRNMSNKTALQEALYDFEVLKQSSSKFSDILFLDAAMAILRTKLDKEKNDIIQAYTEGQREVAQIVFDELKQIHNFDKVKAEFDKIDSGKEPNEDGEKYFEKTFNQ